MLVSSHKLLGDPPMPGKPRTMSASNQKLVTRLVFNNIPTDTHYKIHQAAGYFGENMQNFVIRAIKKFISESNIPSGSLTHETLAPLDITSWFLEEPSIQLVTFIDTDGTPYTNIDLIKFAKATLNSQREEPTI